MHDGDELCLEPGLNVTGNMLNGRGDGIPGGEQRIHNNAEVFNLEIDLIQGFKEASIIEIVVKRHS